MPYHSCDSHSRRNSRFSIVVVVIIVIVAIDSQQKRVGEGYSQQKKEEEVEEVRGEESQTKDDEVRGEGRSQRKRFEKKIQQDRSFSVFFFNKWNFSYLGILFLVYSSAVPLNMCGITYSKTMKNEARSSASPTTL